MAIISCLYVIKYKESNGVFFTCYEASPATWDHTVFVTCYPTQVNAPRLNRSQTDQDDLLNPKRWKAESILMLVISVLVYRSADSHTSE